MSLTRLYEKTIKNDPNLKTSLGDFTGGKIFGVTTEAIKKSISGVSKSILPSIVPPTDKDADKNLQAAGLPITAGRGISQAILTGPAGIPFADSVNLSQQILTGDDYIPRQRRTGARF